MQATIASKASPMARKANQPRSESRKHTAMVRVSEDARDKATKAAALMGESLADYVTRVLTETADRDIIREARKLTGNS